MRDLPEAVEVGDDDVVAIFQLVEGVGLMQPERVSLGGSFGYGPGRSTG